MTRSCSLQRWDCNSRGALKFFCLCRVGILLAVEKVAVSQELEDSLCSDNVSPRLSSLIAGWGECGCVAVDA
jgi:hypothetical protein